MRILAAALGALALAGLAQAETAEPVLPPELSAAYEGVRARFDDKTRFAFTHVLEAGDVALTMRFDPALPKENRWTLVAPAEAELSKQAKSAFDELRKNSEDADVKLVARKPEGLLDADAAKLKEEAGAVYFAGRPTKVMGSGGDGEKKQSAALEKFLKAELGVTAEAPFLKTYRLFAEKPFKPVVVAKIKRFDMTITFAEAWPGGPIVTSGLVQDIAGSAMMQEFEEKVVMRNEAFEARPGL